MTEWITLDPVKDIFHGHLLSLRTPGGVGSVAPDATQIAARRAYKKRRYSAEPSFTLNRVENLRDAHKATLTKATPGRKLGGCWALGFGCSFRCPVIGRRSPSSPLTSDIRSLISVGCVLTQHLTPNTRHQFLHFIDSSPPCVRYSRFGRMKVVLNSKSAPSPSNGNRQRSSA